MKAGETMPSTPQQSTNIKELTQRFHVCWDVWPEYAFIKHEKRQIGFELDLSGTPEGGEENPEPDSEQCLEIYQALIRIAEDVLPSGNDDIVAQFEPYDQGIHYSPRRGNRPEVVLRVRIIHRKAFERPVDDAQIRYLDKLQQQLEERGIGQH